ncbi:MAG TPA: class I SAM-dependent rRNA methyltransferase [Polyangia bacterium]|jgi:23S rRNA (cytosine1962-C5)-methyltransferase
MRADLPPVTVTARAAQRLRAGQPWVWPADVSAAPPGDPDVVRILDPRGRALGTGLYAGGAQLPLRLWDAGGAPLDEEHLRARFAAAIDRRRALAPGAEACRLIHAEADRVPGLIVDRYGDALAVQTLSRALDRREDLCAALLAELTHARVIVARDDASARDFEGLPRRAGLLRGAPPTRATYHEGAAAFEVDLLEDAKTGGFLDQRENHARARAYARGRGLDTFTYHGGFALALAQGCSEVLAVDENGAAVARARENATRSGFANVTVEVANAFDLLRRLEAEGRTFDVIVVDPPALAKRQSALAAAERGYRELNVRALRLLAPEGTLITCSCSARMTPDRFEAVLEAAAGVAGRTVQVLERRGAAADHPGLLGVPATEYLKCFVLRAL